MPFGETRILLRRSIVRRLLKAVESHRLVVVVSPMGYGKTTIARQFAEWEQKPVYLFSTPANSNNADSVWNMLWQEAGKQGMVEAPLLQRMGFPKNSLHIQYAIDTLDSVEPAVIILDDYHHCAIPVMDAFIEEIVRNGNGNCHIVLFSRTTPEMNLEQMAREGIALVNNQEFLAFSNTEAKEFFILNDVFDEAIASEAWKYSEGWAAALWMFLQYNTRAGGIPPSKDIESLMDSVVYSSHSPPDRAMLKQLSILDRFTTVEAEMLTVDGNARHRLKRILNKNAFLTRDAVRRTYQIHGIFRDFLRKRLEADKKLNTQALYRRAAECYAARRDFMAAYRMLSQVGRVDDQARILELLADQAGEITADCQLEEIHRMVRAIPWRVRLRKPFGYIAYIWLCISAGDESFSPQMLQEAEEHFANAKYIPPTNKRRLAGELEYIRGALAFNDYTIVAHHYLRAHQLLGGPSFINYRQTSWSYCCPYLNFAGHRHPGRFHLLKDLMETHHEKVLTVTAGASAGSHIVTAVEYHLERGELDVAEEKLAEVKDLVDETEHTTTFLLLSFSRARLLVAQGRKSDAAALLLGIARRIERAGMFEHIVCHELSLGYILATIGRMEGIPRWLADGNVYDPPYNMPHTQALSLTIYGKTLIARNNYAELAKLLEKSPNGFGSIYMALSAIHCKIFEALLAKHRHDTNAAIQAIKAALDISRRDGIVLTYAEYADKILWLLRQLRRSLPDDEHLGSILALCKRTGRTLEGVSKYKKNLLTPRENEIMRLVARGKQTRQIAQELGVVDATVKTVLSHVYAKLGVTNRAEAVHKLASTRGRTAKQSSSAISDGSELTKREQEIMAMVKVGLSRTVIAEQLGISFDTVNRIVTLSYAKLKVSNRIQASRALARHYGKEA